ncbi:MAG: TonB-dependent receptor [Bacteroidia bacterium]
MIRSILLALTLLSAIALHAQVDLEVLVVDDISTSPVVDVEVRLANTQLGVLIVQKTGNDGKTLFKGLQPAEGYSLSVVSENPTKPNDYLFELSSNPVTSLTLNFAKIVDEQAVNIIANSPVRINRINAEVSSQLSKQELQLLPVEARDITRSLFRLPNVSQATGFYPEAPNVGINGANSLFTNYLIDGMDNNERFLGGMKFNIPVGMVQGIEVLTNNFSTEFGNTANGVVNITSRTGSNEVTGEVFYLTRPGPGFIDAASPYNQRDLSGNFVKDGFMRHQTGFAVGGPIKKDKTFFYINAEQTWDLKDNLLNVPQLGVNTTVPGNNNFSYLSGKITQLWSDKFHSNLRVHGGKVFIDRQGGGLTGGSTFPSAGNRQDRNSLIIASQNTYIANAFKSETNLQYSRFRWNYGAAFNPTSPQVTVQDPSGLTVAVLGHPGYIFDQTENTLQLQQKFNWYLDKHTLKAGIDIISADHQLFGGGNVNGNYTVQLNEMQLAGILNGGFGQNLGVNDIPSDVQVLAYNTELRVNQFGARQTTMSAYLEDRFKASDRLTLTLGLRYDYDNLSKGGSDKGDLNNLAPRFSANYRISKRHSIRLGAGLFYEKIAYALYSDALQQNTTGANYKRQVQALIDAGQLPADTDIDAVTFDGNLGASADNVTYLQGPSPSELQSKRNDIFANERRLLNPNGYQNPQSWQFMTGYQYQVDKKTFFSVDVMHNRTENLFRLRDLNAPAAYPIDPDNVVVRTQAVADLSRPVPILPGGQGVVNGDTIGGIARRVTVTESAGSSRFWGATLSLRKDESSYAYRIHYTLSSLRNNTEDINFTAMDANDFEAEWGPSINDRRHMINALYIARPVKNLSINLAILLQSGQPINRIPDATLYGGTTDLNGDGRSFGNAYVGNSDRHPGESRNSDRLPWSNTFDMGIQYKIKIGSNELSKKHITFRADVFNLFNAVNFSGYSNNATQSNQIQVGSAASGLFVRRNAAPPRQFQFGLTYGF